MISSPLHYCGEGKQLFCLQQLVLITTSLLVEWHAVERKNICFGGNPSRQGHKQEAMFALKKVAKAGIWFLPVVFSGPSAPYLPLLPPWLRLGPRVARRLPVCVAPAAAAAAAAAPGWMHNKRLLNTAQVHAKAIRQTE